MGKSIPFRAGQIPAAPVVSPGERGGKAIRHPAKKAKKLHGLSEIRSYFQRNDEPIYFVSATPFNLLGIDEWIHRFRYLNYIDCFDGQHTNVFVPDEHPHEVFQSLEEIVNYLLEHPQTAEYVASRGVGGKAVFLFFDERSEELAKRLGLEVCFPPAELRKHVDDKIHTVRIGNRAGVRSVPNVLARGVDSYDQLRRKAARLGTDLVIQTPFGDSGHTTFFVSKESDWKEHAEEIAEADEIKIMKRVNVRGAALEACITRHGTIVGPLMTELVGFKELTPYRGGWCGNEVAPEAFSTKVRNQARRKTVALGDELAKLGYRGYFEVDWLVDRDSGAVYLGEINPRITGASSMTNLASFAHADAPLFLFHLLEFMDVDYELDIEAINRRWSNPDFIEPWSQMVIKHTADSVELVSRAAPSGVWQLTADDTARFVRPQVHRRTVERQDEAFFLRIAGVGDYFYEGADLGILLVPGRLMDDDGAMTPRARAWNRAIRGQFESAPAEAAAAHEVAAVGRTKIY